MRLADPKALYYIRLSVKPADSGFKKLGVKKSVRSHILLKSSIILNPEFIEDVPKHVGPNLVFCCSYAPPTPLTAGVTDRRTDGHSKGALGLVVISTYFSI